MFAYSKLGRFIIIGFIREEHPNRWQGSQVRAKVGTIEPGNNSLPIQFLRYLNERADTIRQLASKISPSQLDKIDKAFRDNAERFVSSDQFQALENDVRLFGMAAFEGTGSVED